MESGLQSKPEKYFPRVEAAIARFNERPIDQEDRWQKRALCLGQDTEIFRDSGKDVEEALAFCRSCLVKQQCLDYAIKNASDGYDTYIYGGLTRNERIKERRQRA